MRQFDYDTISDVILHLRYTSREGGGLLRNGAVANLKTNIEEARAAGSMRPFSIRYEFPSEWAKFTSVQLDRPSAPDTAELVLDLRLDRGAAGELLGAAHASTLSAARAAMSRRRRRPLNSIRSAAA